MKAAMRILFTMGMVLLVVALLPAMGAGEASPQDAGEIVVYSPFNDQFMQALAAPFTAETGIEVLNVVISTGETVSRLRAERQRPQADFWLSARPAILQGAFEEGLIAAYNPNGTANIRPEFRYDAAHITAVGTYPLVFFYNTQAIARANMQAPTGDWAQLLSPAYRDQVVMPHPATSGTAYSVITTIIQAHLQNNMSEDEAWQFVAGLNGAVAQFTRSGRAPQTLVAQGEYPVGIGFYDAVWQLQQEGFPLEVVIPNPVFAEPYGAAVVADAPNGANARRFFDYLLTPRAQAVLTQFGNYPVVAGVNPPVGGVSVPTEQVIDIDFLWSSANRRAILDRFQEVTQAEPQ
jgi:iron(III) transport system substrate-binding protein